MTQGEMAIHSETPHPDQPLTLDLRVPLPSVTG
jgi:hypothetical protein